MYFSVYGTIELVNHLLPFKDEPNVSYLEDSLRIWDQQNNNERPCYEELGFQKSWDLINLNRITSTMEFTNAKSKARFQALKRPESNAWLTSLPSAALGTLLDNNTFRISLGIRLGCKLCQSHTCICGDMVDEFGLHGLHCIKSSGRFSRHQEINGIIHRALNSCQVPNRLEPPGLTRNDGKRVDGVTLIPWQNGKCIAWDATCGDTFAPSYVEHSSKEAGYVATKAEGLKRSKYSAVIEQNIEFLAFAVETAGTFGNEALSFINAIGKRLCKATGEIRSRWFLIQRLGLAIQRGNAASLMGTFPFSEKFSEVFYLLDNNNKRNFKLSKDASSHKSENLERFVSTSHLYNSKKLTNGSSVIHPTSPEAKIKLSSEPFFKSNDSIAYNPEFKNEGISNKSMSINNDNKSDGQDKSLNGSQTDINNASKEKCSMKNPRI